MLQAERQESLEARDDPLKSEPSGEKESSPPVLKY